MKQKRKKQNNYRYRSEWLSKEIKTDMMKGSKELEAGKQY